MAGKGRRLARNDAKPNHRNKNGMSDMRRVKLVETLTYIKPLRRRQRLRLHHASRRAAVAWPLAARASRMSIRSGSDREGVNRRIDWPGRIVRSERAP
jgi:hypothetical protein